MFRNVVSTQDLLSDSQRSSYSSDSALFSLSQRQQSQNECSQVRTQDLFTQNPGTGSQSESSFPPTRKMSMYDKWMSKSAMFRKDVTKAANATPLSGQQQASNNATNKPRDTEDRDFMQQVVNIVQDCNKEVKTTLTAVKETMESHSHHSGEKMADTMKAFLEDLWRHEERMLKAVEEGQQRKDQEQDLQCQIAAKDAAILQLQARLEEREKPGDVKQVAKAVRQEMLSPHLAMENKLMEILEVTREVSEQHSQQMTQFQTQVTAQTRDCKEWKTSLHKLLKDMERRLQKDLTSVSQDLQQAEEEWRGTLQEQLLETCTTHTQHMEQLVDRALTHCTTTLRKHTPTTTPITTSAVVSAVKKELPSLLQKQLTGVERSLQTLWQQQTHKQQQQLQHIQHTLMDTFTHNLTSLMETLPSRDTQDEFDPPLTLPVLEEKFDQYHTDLKQQLEDMQRRHMEEVRRLQKDAHILDRALAAGMNEDAFRTVAKSGGEAKGGYPLQRRAGVARISPLSQQAKASLFSRTKPSPVVAVLPQQQSVNTSTALKENIPPTVVRADPEVLFQHQPADLGTKVSAEVKKRKGGRARKNWGRKKRKPQRKELVAPDPNTCSQVEKVSVQQLAVYNFADDHSPDQGRQFFQSIGLQNRENQRSELCSPSASTESYLSSPAMSVMVDTELVWVRRSRWSTSSAPAPHSHTADQRNADMLSSPFMVTSTSQRPLTHVQVEDHTRLSRTRSGVKRLL
ncbi:hypothetical protein ACOMHN_051689 [Nucella lapillus]